MENNNDIRVDLVNVGVVMYCDGSARPQPGFIGWGCHGYIYSFDNIEKPIMVEVNNFLDGYGNEEINNTNHMFGLTDQGYLSGNRLANARPVTPLFYYDFLGSSNTEGTNNKAELLAILNTLEYVLDNITDYKVIKLNILSDSSYAVNGINNWMHSWKANGWKTKEGTDISNGVLWRQIYLKISEVKNRNIELEVTWVKGHNGVFGNTHADTLANIGTNYSIAGNNGSNHKILNVTPAKNYWKSNPDRHPLINYDRIYFNSSKIWNTEGKYYLADPGGTDNELIIGKKTSDVAMAIVRVNTPDKLIEDIKTRQFEIADEINAIIMLRLDKCYNKNVYPLLNSYGKYCLQGNSNNLNLNFIDKKPITIEINPTNLSLRAADVFTILEGILNKFIEYKNTSFDNPDNYTRIKALDITSHFFDTKEKKVKGEVTLIKVMKDEFKPGHKQTNITIKDSVNNKEIDITIPLLMGKDILPRNNLKRLEDHNPRVYLITWRDSELTLNYATIVESDLGMGIWSNYFSNRVFLSNK